MDDEDEARKAFLHTLTDALGPAWSFEFGSVRIFGVIALVLRHPNVPDEAVEVVPSVVWKNVLSWKPFPGKGRPHFDIRINGDMQRTWVVEEAVGILERWLRSRTPVVRSTPIPIIEAIRPTLEAIARAPAVELDVKLDIERWPPTPEGARRLEEIRREIDLDAVAIGFPREDDGRLKLSSQVLLEEIPAARALPRGRAVFAILRGPRTRGDGERLELAIEDAIGENAACWWTAAPWLWRRGHAIPKLDAMGHAFVALLDKGRFDEALALNDLRISDKAIWALEMAGASRHAGDDQYMLRRTLWQLAPWQLPRRGGGRLALLPHQTGQVKTWIAYYDRVIDLENTGSNARLSETEWKRPLQIDLERLGLERRSADSPKKKKETAKKPEPSLAELIAGKKFWKATRALEVAKRRAASEVRGELLAIARGQGTDDERANALWILGQVGTADDGEALFAFLEDPADDVCRMAIEGVKRTGYGAAVPTLARLALGGGYRSTWSLTAMSLLSGKKGPSGLVGYLDHEDPRVREAACVGCKAFVKQGLKLATAPLEARLSDPDAAVVEAATDALGRPRSAR